MATRAAGTKRAVRAGPTGGAQPEPRGTQLSRDGIVEAAIRVVRSHGLQDLTMARVADELGVTAAAIYYYVPDKAGMIDLAVDAILTDLITPGAEYGTWDERLRRWANDFFTLVSEHRGLGPQLARNPRGTTALRLARLSVELLCEAGMTPAEAIRAQAPLRWYVMGELSDELHGDRAAHRFEVVPDIETAFPDLAELAVHLDALDQREVFLHGIELFIVGFKAEISAKQSDRATA